MGRLFGTDGVRGIAGDNLTGALAFRVGQASAMILTEATHRKAAFLIGKDTRVSSDMLEAALVAGVTSMGADAHILGVAPTPAVAFLTKAHFDAGIVISASHNPHEHNGIKLFSSEGFKLSDALEHQIEELILSENLRLPQQTGARIGRVFYDGEGLLDEYIDHVARSSEGDLSGLRVAVDCANGAAAATARQLFARLGVQHEIFFDKPDGVNINDNCGSTHLSVLQGIVTQGGFDLGLAFDGDADRCLAVDERGGVIDGDRIMAVCGLEEMRAGRLARDTIVGTVMSNLGFHRYCKQQGMRVISAAVGDRYVLEEMQKGGYTLGGEQSGHLIFLRHATTGDGQLTAVQLLNVLARRGIRASKITDCIQQYPQVLVGVTVAGNDIKKRLMEDASVLREIREVEALLGEEGRVLVRPSGTEALVRVMVEGREEGLIRGAAQRIVDAMERTK